MSPFSASGDTRSRPFTQSLIARHPAQPPQDNQSPLAWARQRLLDRTNRRITAAGQRAEHRLSNLGPAWHVVEWPGGRASQPPKDRTFTRTSFLAVGPDAVWVISPSDATVSRVDPATNTVTSTIKVSSGISGGDIAASSDAVWVRGTEVALAVRIDPQTNAVVDRLGPLAGSGGVAVTDTSVWLTAHDIQSIWRLPQ